VAAPPAMQLYQSPAKTPRAHHKTAACLDQQPARQQQPQQWQGRSITTTACAQRVLKAMHIYSPMVMKDKHKSARHHRGTGCVRALELQHKHLPNCCQCVQVPYLHWHCSAAGYYTIFSFNSHVLWHCSIVVAPTQVLPACKITHIA
jgi:hypothetical protein